MDRFTVYNAEIFCGLHSPSRTIYPEAFCGTGTDEDEDENDGQSYPPYCSVSTDPPARSILFVSNRSQQASSSKFTLDKKNLKPSSIFIFLVNIYTWEETIYLLKGEHLFVFQPFQASIKIYLILNMFSW